jgi:hypothetical protein
VQGRAECGSFRAMNWFVNRASCCAHALIESREIAALERVCIDHTLLPLKHRGAGACMRLVAATYTRLLLGAAAGCDNQSTGRL